MADLGGCLGCPCARLFRLSWCASCARRSRLYSCASCARRSHVPTCLAGLKAFRRGFRSHGMSKGFLNQKRKGFLNQKRLSKPSVEAFETRTRTWKAWHEHGIRRGRKLPSNEKRTEACHDACMLHMSSSVLKKRTEACHDA